MQGIDKAVLKKKIEEKGMDFNLYKFIREYF